MAASVLAFSAASMRGLVTWLTAPSSRAVTRQIPSRVPASRPM